MIGLTICHYHGDVGMVVVVFSVCKPTLPARVRIPVVGEWSVHPLPRFLYTDAGMLHRLYVSPRSRGTKANGMWKFVGHTDQSRVEQQTTHACCDR